MEALNIFLIEQPGRGALKGQKERWWGRGVFLIQVRNFHLPYFGIMFEGGFPEFLFKESNGVQVELQHH